MWWIRVPGFRLRASSCGAKLVTRRAPMRSASALDLAAGDEALLWKEDRLWEELEALLSGRWTLTSAMGARRHLERRGGSARAERHLQILPGERQQGYIIVMYTTR